MNATRFIIFLVTDRLDQIKTSRYAQTQFENRIYIKIRDLIKIFKADNLRTGKKQAKKIKDVPSQAHPLQVVLVTQFPIELIHV